MGREPIFFFTGVRERLDQVGEWKDRMWRRRGSVRGALDAAGERKDDLIHEVQDKSWRAGYNLSKGVRAIGVVALPVITYFNPILGLAVGVALVAPEARRRMHKNVEEGKRFPESMVELIKLTGPVLASAYLGPLGMGLGYSAGVAYDAIRLERETEQGTPPRLRRNQASQRPMIPA